jgi:hypothetical protein
MRIVGQTHRVVEHTFFSTGPYRRAIPTHLEGISLTLQVAQAVVVEGCRSMQLVTRVGRNQEEWTVVQTAAHIPHTCRSVVHTWRSKCVVVPTAHLLLTLAFLEGLLASHGWVGQVKTVRRVDVKLVVPLVFKVLVEVGVHGHCLFLVHQLVDLARGPRLKIVLV